MKDNETVYDEQIAPLMQQIIAVCKAHGLPAFATFGYTEDQWCTTALPIGPEGCTANGVVDELRRIVRPPRAPTMDIKTHDKDGQIVDWTRVMP